MYKDDNKYRALIDVFYREESLIGLSAGFLQDNCSPFFINKGDQRKDGKYIDKNTIFEIASITKIFTGLILARMVAEGKVSYSTPVKDLLPKNASVPENITLEHLATHTSGLPRLPDNLTPKDRTNPYADYTKDNLYEFLSSYKYKNQPGKKHLYSNLGYAILGHALALQENLSYEELYKKYILNPLGMKNTFFDVPKDKKDKLAQGCQNGKERPYWDQPLFAPAGALKSTISDMAIFLKVQAECSDIDFINEIKETQKPRFKMSEKRHVGLGWIIEKDFIWHNGRTGGFASFMGVDVKNRTGFVLLSNTATSLDPLAAQLVKL